MKILHITPSYEPAWQLGGVVRSISQLCRELARMGLEVTVYTTDRGKNCRLEVPINQPVDVGGVRVFYFRVDYSLTFSYSQALRHACQAAIHEFDMVHLATFWNYPGIPAGAALRKDKVPYVISTHGTLVPTMSPWQKKAKKWIYRKLVEDRNLAQASAIHYTAELERKQTAYLGLKAPSFVLANGIDIGEFENLPDKKIAKEYWGLSPDSEIILYFGRLNPRKGLDLLLPAFAEVQRTFANAVLILAGPDNGQETMLRNLALDLGIAEKVLFTGYVPPENRNYLLGAADLEVLATHPGENFGYVAVEAMLSGVPVLLSEHVGISREVAADGAGLVVPLEVAAIAGGIKNMLADPDKLQAMGQAAAVAARRRYDIRNVAKEMAAAYEDILTGRRSPGLFWSDR
jgi:glycosyltransferase involved in cell wall biosynthesis